MLTLLFLVLLGLLLWWMARTFNRNFVSGFLAACSITNMAWAIMFFSATKVADVVLLLFFSWIFYERKDDSKQKICKIK